MNNDFSFHVVRLRFRSIPGPFSITGPARKLLVQQTVHIINAGFLAIPIELGIQDDIQDNIQDRDFKALSKEDSEGDFEGYFQMPSRGAAYL